MKFQAASLFLGICLVLAVASTPAHARSVTAFGSFHAQSATVLTDDPYTCITEDNGAAVNNCTYNVNLYFDLPIDTTTGTQTITVQGYWNGPGSFTSFNCDSYAYTGKSSDGIVGTQITFSETLKSLSTKVTPSSGDFISVICWDVPPGEGVATLKWNQ